MWSQLKDINFRNEIKRNSSCLPIYVQLRDVSIAKVLSLTVLSISINNMTARQIKVSLNYEQIKPFWHHFKLHGHLSTRSITVLTVICNPRAKCSLAVKSSDRTWNYSTFKLVWQLPWSSWLVKGQTLFCSDLVPFIIGQLVLNSIWSKNHWKYGIVGKL